MSNVVWEGFTGPIGGEVYVDIDPKESREEFNLGDIIAACRKLKQYGEQPDTIIFGQGAFPMRRRVKGTSKQKKRARFWNRKSRTMLSDLEMRYADNEPDGVIDRMVRDGVK